MKKQAEVRFIDYGNEETTAYARMRPLDAAFKSLPGQAQEARLSFVQPASLDSDYGHEALDRFKQLAEVSICNPRLRVSVKIAEILLSNLLGT